MKYTTYQEEDQIISRTDYINERNKVNKSDDNESINTTILRILLFDSKNNNFEDENILIGREQNKDIYCICIRNQNLNEIYLEKKGNRNGVIYKTFVLITREECEKILTGEIEWLKNHEIQIFNDLYLQITINQLIPKTIVDYKREIHKLNDKSFVVFDKSIKTARVEGLNFFDSKLVLVEKLSKGSIILRYKQELVIPSVVSSILALSESFKTKLAFSI